MYRSVLCGFLLCASPLGAATIVESGPGTGTPLELKLDEFTRTGAGGGGLSVIGDGCTGPVFGPEGEKPFGRWSPSGGKFVTSRDTDRMRWNVTFGPANQITFAITDAFDQPDERHEGPSSFRLRVSNAEHTIGKGANANLHWFTVMFDKVRTNATFYFRTGLNDGFAVSDVSTVCVPK
jgi:hypothetical protein